MTCAMSRSFVAVCLLAASSHAALAQTATAETSMADTTTEAEADGVYDIVVTAQRRSEKIQDIPVAISAFGAQQLERAGVVSIENIAPRVPSFYFGSFGATRPQL